MVFPPWWPVFNMVGDVFDHSRKCKFFAAFLAANSLQRTWISRALTAPKSLVDCCIFTASSIGECW